MAITNFEARLVEESAVERVYVLSATSNGSGVTYYWYREGVLIGVTRLPELVVTVPAGASAAFEVFDNSGSLPEELLGGDVTLLWDAVEGATGYLVRDVADEENPVELARVGASGGRGTWTGAALAEGMTALEVVPLFERGQEGPARPVVVKVVRRPGPPALMVLYDAETGEMSGTVGV
jgi:hypothetical protein